MLQTSANSIKHVVNHPAKGNSIIMELNEMPIANMHLFYSFSLFAEIFWGLVRIHLEWVELVRFDCFLEPCIEVAVWLSVFLKLYVLLAGYHF